MKSLNSGKYLHSPNESMRALYRTAVGLYVLWLIAVLLFALGRYTPFPMFDLVHSTVVSGAVIATILGAGKLMRDGYQRLAK